MKDISEDWQKLWAVYKASDAEVAMEFKTSLRRAKTEFGNVRCAKGMRATRHVD